MPAPSRARRLVTSEKLAPGQKQYWAQVQTGTPPTVMAQSDPAGGITARRINQGNYRVDFGRDITACAFTASPACGAAAAAATSAQASADVTNAQRVAIRIVVGSGVNFAVDANFQVQVLC